MTAAMLLPIIAASAVGSAHCAGMCGPFVAFYAGSDASSGGRRWLAHLAYHAGRLLTYTTLGAIAGIIGAAVDLAGSTAGVGKAAALIAGSAMVFWALLLLAEHSGIKLAGRAAPIRLKRALSRIVAWAAKHPPALRALVLGLSSTLLPCGWLYAFAVVAAGTGSALGGALTLAAFWLGTVPLLLGIGLGVGTLGARLRRHVPIVSALTLLVVGLFAVLSRANLPALAAQDALAAVNGEHACCHHGGTR